MVIAASGCAAFCYILLGMQKYRSMINPITFFSVLWMVVLAGANLHLFEFFAPSIEVNLIILIGSAVYAMVILVSDASETKLTIPANTICGADLISIGWIAFSVLLVLVLTVPLMGEAISAIVDGGGWTALRLENYNPESNYRSTIQIYGFEYLCIPISRATLIVGSIAFLKKSSNGVGILLLGCAESLLCAVVSAGRGPILNVIMILFWALVLLCTREYFYQIIKLVFKPTIMILIIGIIVFILLITEDRHVAGATLGSTIYQYYFSGPTYLSQLLMQDNLPWIVNRDYMLGWATFGFIINLPLTVGLVLGLGINTSNYWIGSVLTSGNLQIGENAFSNAMCTVYYDFLLDWGWLGAVIGPMILALITIYICKQAQSKRSIFWVSIVILWVFTLFRTTFRWDPVDITFSITVVFLYLFTHKRKRADRKVSYQAWR